MEEQNLDVKLALEEMRFNMQVSLDNVDAINQKMNLVLVASGNGNRDDTECPPISYTL